MVHRNGKPPRILDLDFPYPPQLDQYWPEDGARIWLGPEGRRYREQVASILAQYTGPPLVGRLSGHIMFHPPDRRHRDFDDALLALLDALMHSRAFESEDQFRDIELRRGPVVPGGKVVVLVEGAS